MKFTKILGAGSEDGTEVTLRLLDTANSECEITLTRDLSFELTLAIRQALARRPSAVDDLRRSVVYRLAGCQRLAVGGGSQGLVLVTHEGFQIPLILDEPEKVALRRAIDELDRPEIPPSLSQH